MLTFVTGENAEDRTHNQVLGQRKHTLMKAKMQILLSVTVMVLVSVGSAMFISLSYNYLLQELQTQIVKDNQAIGEQLLSLFSEKQLTELPHERRAELLQNICDTVRLPNGGFVCAISHDGKLIASPGQKPGTAPTFASNMVFDFDYKNERALSELPHDQSFKGLFSRDDDKTDIIAAIPVEQTDIRLLVHQNLDELRKRIRGFIHPLIVIGIIVSLIIGLVTYLFSNSIIRTYEHQLEKINQDIVVEKQKSDKLLLNILPARVANDLKETGQTKPESFENVTVFFSDIVGFTKLASTLDPKFLIDELDDMFTAFDTIMEEHHCERIKTIGDAYLAVCGMPDQNENHAEHIINAANKIIRYIETRNEHSKISWKIRVGIHSGKVVGGVVGVKKYIYDVFGDAINTASRMESQSEPMKINVSESTYQIVKDRFRFVRREAVEIKGKGRMMMYFVEA